MNVTADAFITITLTEHLRQFSTLNPMEIGGIYLCLFLSYGLSAPLSGWIGDRWKIEYYLQAIGCTVLAASFVLIGPASFLNMKPNVWIVVVALLIKGIGAGPLISCSLSSALRAALTKGKFDQDFRTCSLVSSSVTFAIPLGNTIGSFVTGIMYTNIGMPYSVTVFAASFMLLAIVLIIMAVVEQFTERQEASQALLSTDVNVNEQ
ncbi:Uncharacterised protein g10394 [Pycnogonum litorale]